MKGSVLINNIDIDDLGMFILKGGDYDFLSFPERKEPSQTDWFEYDGIDVDLSEVYFKAKKVVVKFYLKAENQNLFKQRLNVFYNLLKNNGFINLYSREFGKTFKLRYVTCAAYEHKGGFYKDGFKRAQISVEFSMDNPLQIFSNTNNLTPRNGRINRTYVVLNGRDLAEFGIIVTQCYNTAFSLSSLKKALVFDKERSTGLVALPSVKPKLEAKPLVIDCVMTADTRSDFYYNYDALFNNIKLTEPLKVNAGGESRECYYQNMSNFEKIKSFGYGAKVKFSLTLMQIK